MSLPRLLILVWTAIFVTWCFLMALDHERIGVQVRGHLYYCLFWGLFYMTFVTWATIDLWFKWQAHLKG